MAGADTIRGARSKEQAAPDPGTQEPAPKPQGLRGAKLLSVLVGDKLGPPIPFEVQGVECFVRLAPAATEVIRNFQVAARGSFREEQPDGPDGEVVRTVLGTEGMSAFTQAQIELMVASIRECMFAHQVGDRWEGYAPPEGPPAARQRWLREVLAEMDPELFDLLAVEVAVVNGMVESPEGN